MDYWMNLYALLGRSLQVYSCYGRFVGKDGSMGLRTGEVYAIDIYRRGGRIWVDWAGGLCPYDTVGAIKRIWVI